MANLNTVEIKVFIPAKDFALSMRFYADLGFTLASNSSGIAYFYCGNCSFLLQDFYQPELAENLMMHLLVEDIQAWHQQIVEAKISNTYGVQLSEIQEQPWGMLDFTLHDPSGVLWRFGQNIPSAS